MLAATKKFIRQFVIHVINSTVRSVKMHGVRYVEEIPLKRSWSLAISLISSSQVVLPLPMPLLFRRLINLGFLAR